MKRAHWLNPLQMAGSRATVQDAMAYPPFDGGNPRAVGSYR